MGRRFRTVLSLGAGGLLALGAVAKPMAAQPPLVGASPAATPWVQAPPAAGEPSKPAVSPTAATLTPPPGGTAPPPKPAPRTKPNGAPLPGGAPRPGGPGQASTIEDTKAKMERERRKELATDHAEQAPDEQKTFEQNTQLWDRMTRDERQAMREAVGGRIRVEMDEAYKRSGLSLNDDQRELFDLRYRQERRKVEREVQEIARRERDRRLPAVDEQLRREFGRASSANAAKAAATPAATPTVPATVAPQPTATAEVPPKA